MADKRAVSPGCALIFCRKATGRRGTSQKGLAPGRANWSARRWRCGQAPQARQWDEYRPAGISQPTIGLLLSALAAHRVALGHAGLPDLLPVLIADDVAQGQHGIDMRSLPMHAHPFESCFHHQLVSALHDARSNGPTRLLIGRILHVRLPFLQVSQLLAQWCHLRVPGVQATQLAQHVLRTLVLEIMKVLLQPLGRKGSQLLWRPVPSR